MFNDLDPSGRVTADAMTEGDLVSFRKSLEAGYGTDLAALTGGAAIRLESLEATLMSVVQTNKHFRLFNALKKSAARATVDEWVQQTSVGGWPGSSFNSETGTINEQVGEFARKVALVKYLMTRRSVSFVQAQQATIVGSVAVEQVNGTVGLLTSVEWGMFEGDSAVIPQHFDGLRKIITDAAVSGNIIDMRGEELDPTLVLELVANIADQGQFGVVTDLFMSNAVQADLDNSLDPAFRVPLTDVPGGGVQLGAPVVGIRTSWGNVKANPDVYVTESRKPFEVTHAAHATASNPTPAANLTAVVAPSATSQFVAADAGDYYYRVASLNKNAESTTFLGAAGPYTVAAGDKVTLTITRSGAADETGYAIYRGRRNGTSAAADMRLVKVVALAGATTPFVDENADIPGTSTAYFLNMDPAYDAISWRQLLPMTKFQLYPSNKAEIPWAQLLFGYLRVTKQQQHGMVKNILPSKAAKVWDPRG